MEFHKNHNQLSNIGNAVIANITSQGSYELRIDMEDAASQRYYALYSTFSIDVANGYKLSLGSYTGDAGYYYHVFFAFLNSKMKNIDLVGQNIND